MDELEKLKADLDWHKSNWRDEATGETGSIAKLRSDAQKRQLRLNDVVEYVDARKGTDIPSVCADVIVNICDGLHGKGSDE